VAMLGPIVPLADSLLRLWVNAETADGGALLLRTLALGGVVGCGSNVFNYCAMGLGRTDLLARMSWLYSFLAIACTILLIWFFGPMTAGAGLLLASVVRVAIAMYWTRIELFADMRSSEIIISTLVPLAVGVLVPVGLTLTHLGHVSSWWALIPAYAGMATLTILSTILLTMLFAEGRQILSRIHQALRVH
ncbi:MAG: hypothetical protein ACN6N0_17930, partial [Microvirgula sp.]